MQNLEVLAQTMTKLELFLSSVQIRCGAAAEGKTQFYCLDGHLHTQKIKDWISSYPLDLQKGRG